MNAVADTLHRRRTHRGHQSGFTLIEVLLVVGITGLLLGPLLAWTVLVMRQQPVEQDGMIRTAQASLLRTHFAPDVTAAGAADVYAASERSGDFPAELWETWRQECIGGGGEDGRPLTVLLAQRGGLVKTIYSVAPADDGGEPALWRDRCIADTGELLDTTRVVERVVDDPARTVARCTAGTREGDVDPCRRINLSIALPDAPELVELSATRRADARSLDRDDATGNLLPFPFIDVSRTQLPDSPVVRVQVSGSRSFDPDGDDAQLTFRWELPTGPEGSGAPVEVREGPEHTIDLSAVGTYVARLTVTDVDGGSSSTYRRIATVMNQPPVAVMTATPKPLVAGESVLSLSAEGSRDPDGNITSYDWLLLSEEEDAEGLELPLTGPTAQWPVPEWAYGTLVVQLTVTDDRGESVFISDTVPILDPNPPPPADEDPDPNDPVDPGDPGDPGGPGDPDPVPGAPVADLVVQVGADRQVTLDASGSAGQGLTYEWNFGLLAGGGGSGPAVVTHTYPAAGTYTARVTVRDDQGRSATRSVVVVIPGNPQAPLRVRVENGALVWDPRPGARRYLVDVESVGEGCARAIQGLATGASEQPRRALPPNPCGSDSTVKAQVGTEASVGGPIAWSGWINVPNEVTK